MGFQYGKKIDSKYQIGSVKKYWFFWNFKKWDKKELSKIKTYDFRNNSYEILEYFLEKRKWKYFKLNLKINYNNFKKRKFAMY